MSSLLDSDTIGVIVCGKQGVGKTSLINWLHDYRTELDQYERQPPITYHEMTLPPLDSQMNSLTQTAKMLQSVEEAIKRVPTEKHVFVIVVGAPERNVAAEQILLTSIRQASPDAVITLVLNRIDLLPPTRTWEPDAFSEHRNDVSGLDEKTSNIVRWGEYVATTLGFTKELALFTCSEQDSPESAYGISLVFTDIVVRGQAAPRVRVIPETTEEITAGHDDKRQRARRTIAVASAAAAATAAIPEALTTMGALYATQTAMLIALASIYGADWRNIRSILGPLLGTTAQQGISALLKPFFPDAGLVISLASAGTVTAALGETYLSFLEEGNHTPSADDFQKKLRENLKQSRGSRSNQNKDK